jgi:hypothetical protein
MAWWQEKRRTLFGKPKYTLLSLKQGFGAFLAGRHPWLSSNISGTLSATLARQVSLVQLTDIIFLHSR